MLAHLFKENKTQAKQVYDSVARIQRTTADDVLEFVGINHISRTAEAHIWKNVWDSQHDKRFCFLNFIVSNVKKNYCTYKVNSSYFYISVQKIRTA